MKYELKYKKQPQSLEEMLIMRGVTNLELFCNPSIKNCNESTLLDNMHEGAILLLKHIQAKHPIDIIVD